MATKTELQSSLVELEKEANLWRAFATALMNNENPDASIGVYGTRYDIWHTDRPHGGWVVSTLSGAQRLCPTIEYADDFQSRADAGVAKIVCAEIQRVRGY